MIERTFTTLQIIVPVTPAWDFAMPVATPRTTIDPYHLVAGKRA